MPSDENRGCTRLGYINRKCQDLFKQTSLWEMFSKIPEVLIKYLMCKEMINRLLNLEGNNNIF